ncbi:hypothetical protein [Corynebacterium hylobatis]|nr:hypothetical protein [Corynebacterium hylobatis]
MDFSFDKLVTLTPQEGAEEALVCGPEGCAPAPTSEPEPEPGDHA